MARQVNIPPQYSARVGGDGINWTTITVNAESDFTAARELGKYGIPFSAANSFQTSTISGTGATGITALESINPNDKRKPTWTPDASASAKKATQSIPEGIGASGSGGPLSVRDIANKIKNDDFRIYSSGKYRKNHGMFTDPRIWESLLDATIAAGDVQERTGSWVEAERGRKTVKTGGEDAARAMELIANALVSSAPNGEQARIALRDFHVNASKEVKSRGYSEIRGSAGGVRYGPGSEGSRTRLEDSPTRTLGQVLTYRQSSGHVDEKLNDYKTNPDLFNNKIEEELSNVLNANSSSGGGDGGVKGPTGGSIDNPMTKTYAFEPFSASGEQGDYGEGGGSMQNLFRPENYFNEEYIPDSLKELITEEKKIPVVGENAASPTGETSATGFQSIDDIVQNFESRFGMSPTVMIPQLDAEGYVVINPTTGEPVLVPSSHPLLAQMIDLAGVQNGFISEQQIQVAQAESAVEMTQMETDSAAAIALSQGMSAEAVAAIRAEGEKKIASTRRYAEQYIARQNLQGVQEQAAATIQAATLSAEGQVGAAEAASAGQASVATITSNAQQAIAKIQSAVGLDQNAKNLAIANVQAEAQQAIAAAQSTSQQGVAATQAGAQVESAGLQSNAQIEAARLRGASETEIAGIAGGYNSQIAQTSAGAQLGSAQAAAGAASPYGFMQQGGTTSQLNQIFEGQNAVGMAQANPYGQNAADRQKLQETQFNPYSLTNAQGFGLGQANAANNPYAAAQLGQGQEGIDQILRGGLSASQRLAEINAGQAGQNFANQLNFMSNPSAIGFATEQGLFGGGNNQVLQDINNSPEGNVPGSLFGFNSPSAAGAGGNQTTNTGNFNANTLRNASDEQIGFLQGAASAGGQSPSEFNQQVDSFTPQGL